MFGGIYSVGVVISEDGLMVVYVFNLNLNGGNLGGVF